MPKKLSRVKIQKGLGKFLIMSIVCEERGKIKKFINPSPALQQRPHRFTKLRALNQSAPIIKKVSNYLKYALDKFISKAPPFDMLRHEFSLGMEQLDRPT